MEKKTIGSFISALRKANGMTQKDLAEQLNVSDKTVSRWERDDGSPDLSVIPAIAEIFGVTCDELLRGERKSPSERTETSENKETSAKGEKQKLRLLKSAFSQYQNLTYIAIGISVLGLIVALICNLAFLEAVLGFLLGAIFFAASIVCQAVFINRAFLSVEDAGLDEISLSGYKRKVIGLAQKAMGLTLFLIGFTFPLVMTGAYLGLEFGSLLLWGSLSAVIIMFVYAVVLFFVNGALLKKGIYSLSVSELEGYTHNRKLKKKCAIRLAIILIITLLLQLFSNALICSDKFTASVYGITFDDYESFVAFMEEDVPDYMEYSNGFSTVVDVLDEPENSSEYDEEDLTMTIEDADGNVVCTYIQRNHSVVSISYGAKDGTVLPIQVITSGGYQSAARLADTVNVVFCAIYVAELLALALIYFTKRKKD